MNEANVNTRTLKEKNKKFLVRTTSDAVRAVFGALLLGTFLYPWFDDVNGWTVLANNLGRAGTIAGYLVCAALVAHILRRVLFPYLDLKDYFIRAKQNEISSSLVILSISMFTCSVLIGFVFLFKHG